MLTIKDGELVPAGRVRSRTKGIDRLFDFVKNAADIQDVAVRSGSAKAAPSLKVKIPLASALASSIMCNHSRPE